MVALKVFKKTSPDNRITVYLGRRDFIDHLTHVDPIDGVVVLEDQFQTGRPVIGELILKFRYGREEDEVMGLKFQKEMSLAKETIYPRKKGLEPKLTRLQENITKKFSAERALPFLFTFPNQSPSSVTLQMNGHDDQKQPIGVLYFVKLYVADDERGQTINKRSAISLAIKKLQYAPMNRGMKIPSSLVSKGFTFSNGKINLEVTLDKELYYHGEKIAVSVVIGNNSRKSVKSIKVLIVQYCEITTLNNQFSKHVADLETKEGCPITPGVSFTKVFHMVPLASSNKDKTGLALDGYLKDDDVNLASSTIMPDGKSQMEANCMAISYTVRVKLNCGTLGGDLTTDVPFKLMHPPSNLKDRKRVLANLKKQESIAAMNLPNTKSFYRSYDDNDGDDIVFEDFGKKRFGFSFDGDDDAASGRGSSY